MRSLRAVLVFALLLAPSVADASSSFLQRSGDAARTGAVDDAGPDSTEVAWSILLPGSRALSAPPLILGRDAYVLLVDVGLAGRNASGLYRVDLDHATWSEVVAIGGLPTALASDGTRFFVANDASVDAYFGNGARAWSAPQPHLTIGPHDETRCVEPAVRDGVIILACTELAQPHAQFPITPADRLGAREHVPYLLALDAVTGAVRWQWRETVNVASEPSAFEAWSVTLLDNVAIMTLVGHEAPLPGGYAPRVDAVRVNDGSYAWSRTALEGRSTNPFQSPSQNKDSTSAASVHGLPVPTGAAGSVYLRFDSPVEKVNATTGRTAQIAEGTGEFGYGSLAITGDRLYVAADHTVLAYDLEALAPRANFTLPRTSDVYTWDPSGALYANGTLYAFSMPEWFQFNTRELYAFDHDLHVIWKHTFIASTEIPFYTADEPYLMAIGNGVLAVAGVDGSFTVVGSTAASVGVTPVIHPAYPQPGQVISVDLGNSTPGVFGPASQYRADWGDGTTTPWQSSSTLGHAYASRGDFAARFYARNANQSSSRLVMMDVGSAAPAPPLSLVQRALAPEAIGLTLAGAALSLLALIGIFLGVVTLQRDAVLRREMRRLDEAHARAAASTGAWRASLATRRQAWSLLLKKRRLSAASVLLLERHADELGASIVPVEVDARALQVGSELLTRYRVERFLGEGGQGRAFLARDDTLGRDVVLKVIPKSERAAQDLRVLAAEARLAGGLEQPNVVRVYDVVDTPLETIIVMEFVPGGTLRALLKRRGKLPADEACTLADGILAGLEAAHARGIVHRDIKPENILLARDGTPKISDFGAARDVAVDHATMQAGPNLGTLAYMSPEQVRGGRISAGSDVYSAGLVLYEMLSGRRAVDTEGLDDFLARSSILHDAPDLGAVPAELRELLARALAKEPSARFSSAGEMREALATFVAPQGRRSS